MKLIKLLEISLENFKGIRKMDIGFNEDVTRIYGRNGSGKTSVFDAFTWLLFGKDSQDKKAFGVKTYDSEGNYIPKLTHSVEAKIEVGGEVITLCRRLKDKWVKRRGTTEEQFMGNEEERLYNNVPLSLKEWNDKIAGICSEQVFKFITNPAYFSAQKTEAQRAMLFRMAGDVSDEEIVKDRKDLRDLLDSLTGKSMEEYKREIQANKRRINSEKDSIPGRIDERKREIEQLSGNDFVALEAELKACEDEAVVINRNIADRERRIADIGKDSLERNERIIAFHKRKGEIEMGIKMDLNKRLLDRKSRRSALSDEIADTENRISDLQLSIQGSESSLKERMELREQLIAEWKAIKAERLVFDGKDFICPTCHRPLDPDDIEEKRKEMIENFNRDKADRLARNEEKGKGNKSIIEHLRKMIYDETCVKAEHEAKLEDLNSKMQEVLNERIPSADDLIKDNKEIEAIEKELESIDSEIVVSEDKGSADEIAALQERRKELDDRMNAIKVDLSKREAIERNEERVKELEIRMADLSQAVADLERVEFSIAEYNKARINAIEARINGMFDIVRFKMFDTQINGGELETCEAMVNGVPYSDQNKAMRVNMGIDIIRAICKSEGICAPIFIDNCESVMNPMETESQQIRLYVSNEDVLTIK